MLSLDVLGLCLRSILRATPFFLSRKKSILDPELIEVRRNELQHPNPYRLHTELATPSLNQTLDSFAKRGLSTWQVMARIVGLE